MGFVVRSGAAVAVAAVTGATVLATPVERPALPVGVKTSSMAVDLSASSRALAPWPLLITLPGDSRRGGTSPTATVVVVPGPESTAARKSAQAPSSQSTLISPPALASQPNPTSQSNPAEAALTPSAPDQIDSSFIDFRIGVRNDFVAFANRLGYLGKQLYVAFNFGESIVASLVFNGTDILRGEGLLKNLGDIGADVALSALFVVIDEFALASTGVSPIAIARPPFDRPSGWTDANPPFLGQPLTPVSARRVEAPQALVEGDAIGAEEPTARKKSVGAKDVAVKAAGSTDSPSSDLKDPAEGSSPTTSTSPAVSTPAVQAPKPKPLKVKKALDQVFTRVIAGPKAAKPAAPKSQESESDDKGSSDASQNPNPSGNVE